MNLVQERAGRADGLRFDGLWLEEMLVQPFVGVSTKTEVCKVGPNPGIAKKDLIPKNIVSSYGRTLAPTSFNVEARVDNEVLELFVHVRDETNLLRMAGYAAEGNILFRTLCCHAGHLLREQFGPGTNQVLILRSRL